METLDFAFHRLSSRQFEDVAASVLQDKFGVPILTFSDGRDGGRDASARNINVQIGDKKLRRKNVVVQVKHTKTADSVLDDSARHRLFRSEVCKVVTLAEQNELDIYFIVLNFRIPAGQEQKLVKMFRCSACKYVYVIGSEMLVRWIQESHKLGQLMWRLYGLGGPTTHEMFDGINRQVLNMRKELQVVLTRAEAPQKDISASQNEIVREQLKCLKQTNNIAKLVQQVQHDLTHKADSLRDRFSDLEQPVRSLSRSVSCTQETVQALSYTVHKNQRTLEAMRKSLTKAVSDTEHYTKAKSRKSSAAAESSITQRRNSIKQNLDYCWTTELLLTLTCDLGVLGSWRFVMRSLGVTEEVVRDVSHRYGTLREQAYQAFTEWAQIRNGPGMIGELLVALRTWNLNKAANLVEQKMRETQKKDASRVESGSRKTSQTPTY